MEQSSDAATATQPSTSDRSSPLLNDDSRMTASEEEGSKTLSPDNDVSMLLPPTVGAKDQAEAPDEATKGSNDELDKSNEHDQSVISKATVMKKEGSSDSQTTTRRKRNLRVALLHSEAYTQALLRAMEYIHRDRDVLLASLLDYCGFVWKTPKFLTIIPPKQATRQHMEKFHHGHYLDLLAPPPVDEDNGIPSSTVIPHHLLDSMGLTEDCHLPTCPQARHALWNYCRYVVGASLQAAHLLATDEADVAINWGGGRHHAHPDRAGGFCFVNDVVLAVKHLQQRFKRILYIDIDIHHADGVQEAFYDTNHVMTVSLHRHAPGFFPSSSGSTREKGRHSTPGVGYNLNVPLPKACGDGDFCQMFQYVMENLLETYRPETVVLCVGADGLKDDPLVGEADGWKLSPEGVAECVRFASMLCSGEMETPGQEAEKQNGTSNETSARGDSEPFSVNVKNLQRGMSREKHFPKRKLLVLGGGGYNAPNTARTFLLCTAGACEGARPGMLWKELPRDIPRHEHFPRYGPGFELVSHQWNATTIESKEAARTESYQTVLEEGRKAVDLTVLYLRSQEERAVLNPKFCSFGADDAVLWSSSGKAESSKCAGVAVVKGAGQGRRRRKRKKQPLAHPLA